LLGCLLHNHQVLATEEWRWIIREWPRVLVQAEQQFELYDD